MWTWKMAFRNQTDCGCEIHRCHEVVEPFTVASIYPTQINPAITHFFHGFARLERPANF
jgi:hypothetical protein